MIQRIDTYASDNRLEIIKTHERRMIETEKIAIVRKQRAIRISADHSSSNYTQSGNANAWKGRYVDVYA